MKCMNTVRRCNVKISCSDIPYLELNQNKQLRFKDSFAYKIHGRHRVICEFEAIEGNARIGVMRKKIFPFLKEEKKWFHIAGKDNQQTVIIHPIKGKCV